MVKCRQVVPHCESLGKLPWANGPLGEIASRDIKPIERHDSQRLPLLQPLTPRKIGSSIDNPVYELG